MKTLKSMKKVKRMSIVLLTSLFLGASALSANADQAAYKPVPKNPDTHPAYIEQVQVKNGRTYLVADYIQWYEGKDADRIFLQREPDSGLKGAPDGYYIVNDNPKLRTFEVSPKCEVAMQIYNRSGNLADADIIWNESIPLAKFRSLLSGKDAEWMKGFPYHLVVKHGKVVKIIQQFVP